MQVAGRIKIRPLSTTLLYSSFRTRPGAMEAKILSENCERCCDRPPVFSLSFGVFGCFTKCAHGAKSDR